MAAKVIRLKPEQPPRYSPGMAAESWIEVQAQLDTVRDFLSDELRRSWATGLDRGRLAVLQRVDGAVRAIDTEAKRMAAWADATACADRVAAPGHGRAA